ncbi:hypothetical protein NLG97_g737 [Lecanicillium saksenae]|uniref:Uncharacterized protein n=1 Tax=Lecanicillium saksenae TaxID=468837 RepID=A0ACC1R959_9HYPO|nr:hypothetical protein NLG97_g737 [Lecanicillium saksenae]
MSATKEYTFQDVAEHNTKKDCFLVVHDKIYDCSKFIDEHPGGEEVILDVAGQDATEAFEDVGHSDEARETLDELLVGTLKRQVRCTKPIALIVAQQLATLPPAPLRPPDPANSGTAESTGLGIGLYGVVLVGGLLGYFGYQYLQNQQQQHRDRKCTATRIRGAPQPQATLHCLKANTAFIPKQSALIRPLCFFNTLRRHLPSHQPQGRFSNLPHCLVSNERTERVLPAPPDAAAASPAVAMSSYLEKQSAAFKGTLASAASKLSNPMSTKAASLARGGGVCGLLNGDESMKHQPAEPA